MENTGRLPDLSCGRAQFALKQAAIKAEHAMPDDVVPLLSQPLLQDPMDLTALLETGRVLSVHDIRGILSFLHPQHRAASPPVQVTFHRRPRSHQGGRGEQLQCFVGEGYVASASISRCPEAFNLTKLRSSQDIRLRLTSCLANVANYIIHRPMDPSI